MCYPIGARLAQRCILALDTLYHHLFSTPGRDATTTNQLKHDLVLWLTHHSFEELPDALEYYLADPNSDLEGDLAHLTCLDPWGVQVHIHPLVTIYINTLLAWAKCFLATYGVYPGLYDLLDTPRLDFLAAQLHLRDTTLPRPLLHRSRGPPTIRSEYVALQPHLDPSPPPNRLYVCRTTSLSFNTSVCRATRPSVIPTAPTVCLSPRKSVALSVHPTDSPSVIPSRPSHEPSVHPPVTPSMTRLYDNPTRPSAPPTPSHRLYTILPRLSGCPTSHRLHDTPTSPSDHPPPSQRLYDTPTRPSDHPPPSHRLYDTPISSSACPSPADCLTATTTRPPVRPSFPTIHHTHDSNHTLAVVNGEQDSNHSLAVVNGEQDSNHSLAVVNGEQSPTIHRTQDSSQSLAVVNGEQSRKAKIFHRAFTNYDLLLRALDASSIYLRAFRRVAPPKSGEDAHVTRGKCDCLGCSYVLPRLWDPGGVSSSANTPRDLSRTIAPSRYPNALLTGYLIDLPSLRPWQDLRTSHVNLDNFIHRNIAGRTTAMHKSTGSINVIIPALTRTTPTHHERGNHYDRQSSRTNFNATATSYIRVTQNLKRRVEIASPYEGHTSRTFYTRLLDSTSGLLRHTSGLPKILPRLRLTLLTMLGLWGVPYERPRLVDAPITTPTHYLGGRAYVRCRFTTPRWGVTRFYRCLGYVLVVLNLSVPKIIIS